MSAKKSSKKHTKSDAQMESTTRESQPSENQANRGNPGNAGMTVDLSTSSRSQERVMVLGALQREISEADKLLASGEKDVLLDFSACTFISVEGLEWLEELIMRAESMRSTIELVNIPPSIYKAFKVSHIDSVLRACGSPGKNIGPVC